MNPSTSFTREWQLEEFLVFPFRIHHLTRPRFHRLQCFPQRSLLQILLNSQQESLRQTHQANLPKHPQVYHQSTPPHQLTLHSHHKPPPNVLTGTILKIYMETIIHGTRQDSQMQINALFMDSTGPITELLQTWHVATGKLNWKYLWKKLKVN